MTQRIVDITVHIDEELDDAAQQRLGERLQAEEGIVRARYLAAKPHLMVLDYDAERLDAAALLAAVQRQGVHAELLGL